MKITPNAVAVTVKIPYTQGRERVRIAFLRWIDKLIHDYETDEVPGDDDIISLHLVSLRKTRAELEDAKDVAAMLNLLTGSPDGDTVSLHDLSDAEDFFPFFLAIAGEEEPER